MGMLMSAAVPRKIVGTLVTRRVVAVLVENGCAAVDVAVEDDQEYVFGSVMMLRLAEGGGRMVLESSPAGAWQGWEDGTPEKSRKKEAIFVRRRVR